MDFGWHLWKTQKAAALSHKANNYLPDMCWTGEETSKCSKCGIPSKDDTGQKCCNKTDWLIEQQIARYFGRLSALKKTSVLKSSPSVRINEDEEAGADDQASEVETDRTRQKIRRDLAKFRRRMQERAGYSCY